MCLALLALGTNASATRPWQSSAAGMASASTSALDRAKPVAFTSLQASLPVVVTLPEVPATTAPEPPAAPKAESAPAADAAPPEATPADAAQAQVDPSPPASDGSVEDIIRAAAAKYGVDGDRLVRVATCESGLDPSNWHNRDSGVSREYAVEHHYPLGLFQFLQSTFDGNGGADMDIWSASDQAEIAAKMFSEGQAGQWACR